MKTQRGITLVSLTVYVIAATIMVSIIAVLTANFYKNMNTATVDVEPYTEYTKFNSFFTEEMNKENIKILECNNDYIVFNNDVQYTFVQENKGIYKNKVKICRNVSNCRFSLEIENGKEVVKVELTIGEKQYTNTYSVKK